MPGSHARSGGQQCWKYLRPYGLGTSRIAPSGTCDEMLPWFFAGARYVPGGFVITGQSKMPVFLFWPWSQAIVLRDKDLIRRNLLRTEHSVRLYSQWAKTCHGHGAWESNCAQRCSINVMKDGQCTIESVSIEPPCDCVYLVPCSASVP